MFLSRLSDIIEPLHRTEKKSRIFSHLNISYQKIELSARLVDLILTGLASIIGTAICEQVLHDDFSTAGVCFGAGLMNSLLYIYAVNLRGLYRLPVLLLPIPYFSRLIAIFASTALLVVAAVPLLRGNIDLSLWPLISTLLLQLTFLIIARGAFAHVMRTILSAGNLGGRRVVTIGEPGELMGLSAACLLQCFGRKEVSRVFLATKRGCRSDEMLADLDGAIAAALEQGAEEFLIAIRWGSQELLETIRSRLRASPLPVPAFYLIIA
jgi:putative colanic acid biosysnthesis UDP-glucose lipid carrier transferase